MIKHCCITMDDFIEENKVAIYYDKEFRRYSIGMKNGTGAVQTMIYCPWCGSKLPKSLFNKWFDVLESEYGLEDIHVLEIEENPKIPKEFKTDEWWKKRGL